MSDEIKSLIEKGNEAFESFKKSNDERLEAIEKGAGVAELETKTDKQIADIIKSIDLANKESAEAKARVQEIESLAKAVTKGDDEESTEEVKKGIESFFRNANEGDTLVKHLVDLGIEVKGMSIGSDPNGGYLVLPTMGNLTKTRYFESSPVRQVANTVTISTDEYVIPVDNSDVGAYWASELAARTETATPTIGEVRIPVNELVALPAISQRLLDDAYVNVEAMLNEKVADEFSRKEATAFVRGTGVNQPRGFLTYPAWAGESFEANAIQQVNSGTSGTVTADGVIDLQNSLKEVYQAGAVFMMKRSTFSDVVKLKTNDGEYLVNRAFDKNAGVPFSILGAPVYFADDMDAVAADALAIAYGDFRRGYTIVDRIGIRVLRDPYTTYPSIVYKFATRVGGGLVNSEAIKLQKLAS
jgi:HK97 family phage major capsid protein